MNTMYVFYISAGISSLFPQLVENVETLHALSIKHKIMKIMEYCLFIFILLYILSI